MTQLLTVEGVKQAAREHYAAGKLTAQHPKQDQRECAYTIGEYRCAVGAALSAETLRRMSPSDNNTALFAINTEKCGIIFENAESKSDISGIRRRHDDWCNAARRVTHEVGRDSVELARRTFCIAIGLPV